VSGIGPRYEVVDSRLTSTLTPAEHKRRRRIAKLRRSDVPPVDHIVDQPADRPQPPPVEPHEPA